MSRHIDSKRYERQIALKEIGPDGQNKLLQSKVLVIGAGGLGCPALQYLAAAGVGKIGIVDHDIVDVSNLSRQVLFTEDDAGKPKAVIVSARLKALNPHIGIEAYNVELSQVNALEIISQYDLVLDGTDNFPGRYIINDACHLLGKPLVYGAVFKFEGQVGVFNVENDSFNGKISYRDLFPAVPGDAVQDCTEAGVIGVVPGIIGVLQAAEAIKLITGIGKPLVNTILTYNVLQNSFYEVTLGKNQSAELQMPTDVEAFRMYDYTIYCRSDQDKEITPEELEELLTRIPVQVIDIREADELPVIKEIDCERIPLNEFMERMEDAVHTDPVVLICANGRRSLNAVSVLRSRFPHLTSYSLKGGVRMWRQLQKDS